MMAGETAREVRLTIRPEGLPGPQHFELVDEPLPVAGAGEVLVRNRCFLVSASLRQMVSQGAEDVPGVPFPALRPGDGLRGEAIGEVVMAPTSSGLSPGDMVLHMFGWRDYAVVPAVQCLRLAAPLPDPLGYLGYLGHGWTAHAALTRGVQIRAGDTVFISSAAGAIGSMAGQIARLLGAGRVIGSTSASAKADRLVAELGYDAAVIRGTDKSFVAQLREAAPDGIDVFLDNVGGEQLQAAVAVAREHARFVITGTLSGQLAAAGTGRVAPVVLDSTQILLRKITIRGYSADDNPEARDEWFRRLADWCRSGDIALPHVVIDGLEQATLALADTARGRYFGMVVIRL
ncbi:MAG: NADP-dependent oxidoreductase [Bradyrhizobium sp. PARBB1]|jgi:NADPH-dependent curcumin reductase CurA|nr:MAG: 2-alkenal reductase [Bradyrhizobium sp. DFCI-1]MCA3567571.1 NADP-dependent oxidoreductase [Bradyrhizobium sp.]OYU63897.1 MAG: NADP-dependent oxidoreductase [Bradyrhizobium sp. PARBB1]PSO22386.1 NADP-dependent oxidoreductase [Bradyrhizobium sp. MOS004]MCA3579532.1 NADP-dependent oxidoreductase [Bradyrhizobium sp.]